jgi:hypothetical protein
VRWADRLTVSPLGVPLVLATVPDFDFSSAPKPLPPHRLRAGAVAGVTVRVP